MLACIGFANANARSNVTNVGPWSGKIRDLATSRDGGRATGCKRQIVVKDLNNGVEDAFACHAQGMSGS